MTLAVASACKKGDATGSDTATAAVDVATAANGFGRPALALPVAAEDARDADLVLHVRTTCQVRSVAANRFALTARGPINRCTTRAFNAALYVCMRTNSIPPTGDRHGRCVCTAHATTILTQGGQRD